MPILTKKDGRTVRTGRAYTLFRGELYNRPERPLFSMWPASLHVVAVGVGRRFVHHKHGRGLGGGKRDDTFEECVGWCGKCDGKEHNERNHPTATNSEQPNS